MMIFILLMQALASLSASVIPPRKPRHNQQSKKSHHFKE
jgi:hypothetical protein